VIDLLVTRMIMRSKVANNAFSSFDLMIVLVTNKLLMRSKLQKALLAIFDLLKKGVISRSTDY
jgi:hypothetical protein